MITDIRVMPYEFDGQYGTVATYVDCLTGERMSARFPSVMSAAEINIAVVQNRRSLRLRSVS